MTTEHQQLKDKLAIAAERKRSQNATGGCVIVRCSVSAPVWWQKSLRDTQQVAAWFPGSRPWLLSALRPAECDVGGVI